MAACVNHPDRLLAYEEACPLCMNTIEGMERDGDAQARDAARYRAIRKYFVRDVSYGGWFLNSFVMRTLYGQHLRQAGVTPGQAQWEEDACHG